MRLKLVQPLLKQRMLLVVQLTTLAQLLVRPPVLPCCLPVGAPPNLAMLQQKLHL